MVTKEDIERLIAANEEVHQVLAPGADLRARLFGGFRVRRAASILCNEFGWLVHERGTFWEGLQEASERLRGHRERETALLSKIAELVEQEQAVFHRLEIEEDRSAVVVAEVYAALRIVREYEDPSPDALRNLHERLAQAHQLVCDAARNPFRKAFDKMLGYKGALVLAGAAVCGANIAIAIAAQDTISWVSLKVGYNIMHGKVDELIDVLSSGS